MQLAELQRRVMQGIHPSCDARDRQAAQRLLVSGTGLSAGERLAVYRNNITATRVRALQAVYPVCEAILGNVCFAALGENYVWQAADDYADLNVYGRDFTDFLAVQQQRSEFSELPYLRELAMLEWYWHAACYAADGKPFDYQRFAATAARPDRLRFTLADGLALLTCEYPVREIWQRHRDGENPDSVAALQGCDYLCIHRSDDESRVSRVDRATYLLLENLEKGRTLEQLADIPELKQNLAGLLPLLLQRKWISGFQRLPA